MSGIPRAVDKKNPGIPKQFRQISLEFQHPVGKLEFQVVKSKKVWNSRCGHGKKSGIPAPTMGDII